MGWCMDSSLRPQLRRAALAVSAVALLAAVFRAGRGGNGAAEEPANVVARWPLVLLQESSPDNALTTEQASQQCPLFMEQDEHACCWTRSWNCPRQTKGAKGLAMNDGTLSYHCCCTEGFWEQAKNCPRDRDDTVAEVEVRTVSKVDCDALEASDYGSRDAVLEAAEDAEADDSYLPPGRFDCNAGADMWKHGWSYAKKAYCCKQDNTFCEGAAARRLSDKVPKGCKVPPEIYQTAPVVQAQCKQRGRWAELAREIEPVPCTVNPSTKMMTCRRNDRCHGGKDIQQNFTVVEKNLKYDCGRQCGQGSLLINCCNTCQDAREDPSKLGVDRIECAGCEKQRLQYAAQEAHCKFVKGAFRCDTQATCETGKVDEYCTLANNDCDVYPCSHCDAPHLKAKCCAQCLKVMCMGTPQRRMVCDGCDGLPEDAPQWFEFWRHMR